MCDEFEDTEEPELDESEGGDDEVDEDDGVGLLFRTFSSAFFAVINW